MHTFYTGKVINSMAMPLHFLTLFSICFICYLKSLLTLLYKLNEFSFLLYIDDGDGYLFQNVYVLAYIRCNWNFHHVASLIEI